MAYNSNYWKTGDIITSAKLNNIENGIKNSVKDNGDGTIQVNGKRVDIADSKIQVLSQEPASPQIGEMWIIN